MRSSGSTNFGLAGSVVSRTKLRIACLAEPSFHEGNMPLEAVSADAETGKDSADRAGSKASVESKVRRSMPGRRIVSFMVRLLFIQIDRMDCTGGDAAACAFRLAVGKRVMITWKHLHAALVRA